MVDPLKRRSIMRRGKGSILFVGTALFLFYLLLTAWLRTYDPLLIVPDIRGHIVQLHKPFFRASGLAVIVPDYWFGAFADSATDRCRSSILLYEDSRPLGPMHSAEVAKGGGRALHWRQDENPAIFSARSAFYFSSSDDSDPLTNGRSYWAVKPTVDAISCPDTLEKYSAPPFYMLETPPRAIIQLSNFEVSPHSHMVISRDVAELSGIADTPERDQSPVLLYEDNLLLGPAHSLHADIAKLGNGRYSHWRSHGMVFSSSDNSDPGKNGRSYHVVVP